MVATIEGCVPYPGCGAQPWLTVPGWHEDPLSMLPLSPLRSLVTVSSQPFCS